ncbi:MAG: PorV/PorQ family protein [candidate division WOR-3 bacterium]|nr:PorV/PorQ family protein [candidate division WOR-3 bacterium]
MVSVPRLLLAACLLVGLAVAVPTGFSSLKILPGVREAGMAGTGAASAFGPQAITLNPAAGAGVAGFAAVASYTKWILDTHHQSLFVARNFSALCVGVGVSSFSAGEFEYRVKPTEEPIGTFSPTDFTAYLNLARPIGSIVQAGLTGRYFYSRVYDNDAAGLGIDGGVRVLPVKRLTVGASVVDFGKTMSYVREVFWLPTRGRLGVSYDLVPFEHGRVTLAADGSYFFYSRVQGAAAGLEFAWSEVVALRAGYDFLSQANHLNFGLGLRAGVFRFDYSFSAMNLDLGGAHRVSVGLGR